MISSELIVDLAKAFTVNKSLEHFHFTEWHGHTPGGLAGAEKEQIIRHLSQNNTLLAFKLSSNRKLQKKINKITLDNSKRITMSKRFGKTKSAANIKRKNVEHEEVPPKRPKI